MKMSESLGTQTAARNTRWDKALHNPDGDYNGDGTASGSANDASEGERRPAIHAFKGGVYQGFEIETVDQKTLVFAQDHLRILSGLYGVLRPLDAIMPHRLEMGTRLGVEDSNSLYDFWGCTITGAIDEAVESSGSAYLVNLASQEYFRSIHIDELSVPVVTPIFKEAKGSTFRVVGVHAKRQRGKMARYIMERKIQSPDALTDYREDGYQYNQALSTDRELIFVRS